MADSIRPIRVSSEIGTAQKQVAQTAKDIADIHDRLVNEYYASKALMGESTDLDTFEDKFFRGMGALNSLAKILDDFADKLEKIQANYRTAQESAIARAAIIPK